MLKQLQQIHIVQMLLHFLRNAFVHGFDYSVRYLNDYNLDATTIMQYFFINFFVECISASLINQKTKIWSNLFRPPEFFCPVFIQCSV